MNRVSVICVIARSGISAACTQHPVRKFLTGLRTVPCSNVGSHSWATSGDCAARSMMSLDNVGQGPLLARLHVRSDWEHVAAGPKATTGAVLRRRPNVGRRCIECASSPSRARLECAILCTLSDMRFTVRCQRRRVVGRLCSGAGLSGSAARRSALCSAPRIAAHTLAAGAWGESYVPIAASHFCCWSSFTFVWRRWHQRTACGAPP